MPNAVFSVVACQVVARFKLCKALERCQTLIFSVAVSQDVARFKLYKAQGRCQMLFFLWPSLKTWPNSNSAKLWKDVKCCFICGRPSRRGQIQTLQSSGKMLNAVFSVVACQDVARFKLYGAQGRCQMLLCLWPSLKTWLNLSSAKLWKDSKRSVVACRDVARFKRSIIVSSKCIIYDGE
jgi:hypothetical protein